MQKHVRVPVDYYYFIDLEDGIRKVLAKRRQNRDIWRLIISSLLISLSSLLPSYLLPPSFIIFHSLLPPTQPFLKIGGHENGRIESLFIAPALMSACSREGCVSGHSRSLTSQAIFTLNLGEAHSSKWLSQGVALYQVYKAIVALKIQESTTHTQILGISLSKGWY